MIIGPAPQSEDQTEAALDAVLSRGDFQVELPGAGSQAAGVDELPRWATVVLDSARIILWLLAIAAAVVGVILLVRFVATFRPSRRRKPATAPEARLVGVDLSIDLAAVEGVAGEGRFGEAVHLLLLKTFEELCRLADVTLDQSLTSREIVSTIPMPEEAAHALSGLVRAVELSHFGEMPATRGDYELCLGRFSTFRDVLGRPA